SATPLGYSLALHDALPIWGTLAGQGHASRRKEGTSLPLGLTVLLAVAALVFFGAAQRVLDRLRLTDVQALIILGLIIAGSFVDRSEEHTSELQSRENLVCR